MSNTLMDVFNAAGQAMSPFLRLGAEELKERNDLELRNYAARFATDVQDFLRDNPYEGGNSEEESEERYKEYLGKLEDFTAKKYAMAEAQNTSTYSRKMLDQMRGQSLEMMRNHALAEQDKWRVGQEDVSCENDIAAYKTNGVWQPEQVIKAITDRIDLSGTRRPISPQERHKMLQKNITEYYQDYMARELTGTDDPDALKKKWAEIRKQFDKAAPELPENVLDGEGNVTGTALKKWTFEGKDEWDKKALEQEDFGRFYDAEARFQRIIETEGLDAAVKFVKDGKWKEKWDKRYDRSKGSGFEDYSGEYLMRGRGYFDTGELEAARRLGTSGAAALKVSRDWRAAITALMTGNEFTVDGDDMTGKPLEDIIDSVMESRKAMFFYKYGGENIFTQEMWREERGAQMNAFYTDMNDVLKDAFPQTLAAFNKFMKVETYIDKKSEYYHKDFEDGDAQSAISFFKNLFYRQNINDPAVLEAEMKAYTAGRMAKLVTDGFTAVHDADIYRRAAKLDKILTGEEADDLMHQQVILEKDGVTGSGKINDTVFRDERQEKVIKKHAEFEKAEAAKMLGIANANDLEMEWSASTKRKGDKQPKAVFFLEDADGKRTYYKMAYTDNADLRLLEFDSGTGEWRQKGDTVKRPVTPAEDYEARSGQRGMDRTYIPPVQVPKFMRPRNGGGK